MEILGLKSENWMQKRHLLGSLLTGQMGQFKSGLDSPADFDYCSIRQLSKSSIRYAFARSLYRISLIISAVSEPVSCKGPLNSLHAPSHGLDWPAAFHPRFSPCPFPVCDLLTASGQPALLQPGLSETKAQGPAHSRNQQKKNPGRNFSIPTRVLLACPAFSYDFRI